MADTYFEAPSDAARQSSPKNQLLSQYETVRSWSEALSARLSPEDHMLQSMPDASPAKWHLAHTTWFFETFILEGLVHGYRHFSPAFRVLFNSYYNGVGEQHRRDQRGLLSRPSLDEVMDYRAHVDECVALAISSAPEDVFGEMWQRLVLGLNHEQQHQELLLTDILHAFAQHPEKPAFISAMPRASSRATPQRMLDMPGGLLELGHKQAGFCFDNEGPVHKAWLEPYRLAQSPVSNGDWIAFIEDRGYETPGLWLSDGWAQVRKDGWSRPLYWEMCDDAWHSMTLGGFLPLDLDAPVAHISYYEADAFARWSGKRLPREYEWEAAARDVPVHGNFAENLQLRPMPGEPGPELQRGPRQIYGDVWEWTQSAYSPYPGYAPAEGALGEYNGKFMINQMVLRGGSCATPGSHIRASYRNFFYPHQRWQFSGLRLAEDGVASRNWQSAPRLSDERFRRDALEGLSQKQKTLPSKYFYDEEGSRLFDAICELEEYYVPRVEAPLLAEAARDMASSLSLDDVALVEFGSGSSLKTRTLLGAMPAISAYVPIDISEEHMKNAARMLSEIYPDIEIHPLVRDFTRSFALPDAIERRPAIGFFPGSTLGNFTPPQAVSFLRSARLSLNNGWFLVGVDLVKDTEQLIAAYDDSKGITAAFNINLLARLNRELGTEIDLGCFQHRAIWNAEKNRIEMHLVCERSTAFQISGRTIVLKKGETIHTENSHKFTEEGFSELARDAGWRVSKQWISADPAYGLFLLAAEERDD
ncbi:MAG TPA: ergothioneine biosynthesis protein EgtB [Parvibaculum sp.]